MVVVPIILFPFKSPYCLAITHLALWLIILMSKLVEYLISSPQGSLAISNQVVAMAEMGTWALCTVLLPVVCSSTWPFLCSLTSPLVFYSFFLVNETQ